MSTSFFPAFINTTAGGVDTSTTGMVVALSRGGTDADLSASTGALYQSTSGAAVQAGTLPIANGGTGATSASAACTSLGAAPIATPTFTGIVYSPAFYCIGTNLSWKQTANSNQITGTNPSGSVVLSALYQMLVTSSGSAAYLSACAQYVQNAGYTGSGTTNVIIATNEIANTSQAFSINATTIGAASQNIGVFGVASGGTNNVGVVGGIGTYTGPTATSTAGLLYNANSTTTGYILICANSSGNVATINGYGLGLGEDCDSSNVIKTAGQITCGNIVCGTVTTGTWNGTPVAASYVGNLPASQITSGTLALARGGTNADNSSVLQNLVFASPSSGGAGPAVWRALVAADIPSLSSTYLSLSAGGTVAGNLSFSTGKGLSGGTAITLAAVNTAYAIGAATVAGNTAGHTGLYSVCDSAGGSAIFTINNGTVYLMATSPYYVSGSSPAAAQIGLYVSAGALYAKTGPTTYPTGPAGIMTSSSTISPPVLLGSI